MRHLIVSKTLFGMQAVGIIAALIVGTQPNPVGALTLQEVLSSLQDNFEQLKAFEMTTVQHIKAFEKGRAIEHQYSLERFERWNKEMTEEQRELDGLHEPRMLPDDTYVLHGYKTDGRRYWGGRSELPGPEIPKLEKWDVVAAFDGKSFRSYTSTNNTGSVGPEQSDYAKRIENRGTLGNETTIGKYLCIVKDLRQTVIQQDEAFLRAPVIENKIILKKSFDSRHLDPTSKATSDFIMAIEVDPAHGFLIKSLDIYIEGHDGKGQTRIYPSLRWEADMRSLDSLNYPAKVTIRTYLATPMPKNLVGRKEILHWQTYEFTTELYTVETLETVEFRTNPELSDKDFKIEFPRGTQLVDQYAGEVVKTAVDYEEFAGLAAQAIRKAGEDLSAQAGKKQVAQLRGEFARAASARRTPVVPAVVMETKRTTTFPFLIAAVAAGVVIFAGVAFLLWRRRVTHTGKTG
jgi:hypothetical protein